MSTIADSSRVTGQFGSRCPSVVCSECDAMRAKLADVSDDLEIEKIENNRLRRLNANLSTQLSETSHRLINASFEHAAHVIRQLGGEDLRGQSMVFDTTADTTVVDVVIP